MGRRPRNNLSQPAVERAVTELFETGDASTASGTGPGLNVVEQIATATDGATESPTRTEAARFEIGGDEPA